MPPDPTWGCKESKQDKNLLQSPCLRAFSSVSWPCYTSSPSSKSQQYLMTLHGQLWAFSSKASVLTKVGSRGISISPWWFPFGHLSYCSLTQFLTPDISSTYVFPVISQSSGSSHGRVLLFQSKGRFASLLSIMAVSQGCLSSFAFSSSRILHKGQVICTRMPGADR